MLNQWSTGEDSNSAILMNIWWCYRVVLVRIEVSGTRRCARKAAECGKDFVEKKAPAWHNSQAPQGCAFLGVFKLNE
jgi:hypothetical protein